MISSLWFGIWATLSRLEFEYASLNASKNKFGLNFFIWNMQAWTAKINLGLNVGKNKSGLFFFGWATNWAQSLNGARGARLGQVRAPGKNPVPKTGRVRATGLAPRVRSGYEKTRPEPNTLPFLSSNGLISAIMDSARLIWSVANILKIQLIFWPKT